MSEKPNQKNFMHDGKLMETAYDAAIKAWEANHDVIIAAAPIAPHTSIIAEGTASKVESDLPDSSQEDSEIDLKSDSSVAVPGSEIVFKVGGQINWKVTPLTIDGTTAKIKPKSLKVKSGTPSVEASLSTTDENSFVLIPIGMGNTELTISYVSMYGKLVSRTYKITVVDGTDEAVDLKAEYSIQS